MAVLIVLVVHRMVAISAVAAAAQPDPDCADGPDAGVPYITDTGFEVVEDASIPPSADGPFVNTPTIRRGNVTLSADGGASVRLENLTANSVCLGALNAIATAVRVALDGATPVVLEGRATSLALGPIASDHDAEGVDLAYDANDSLTVAFPSTGRDPGTVIRPVDSETGTVRTEETVDDSGALALTLPAGRAASDLATVTPPTPTQTGTPPPTVSDAPTEVATPGGRARRRGKARDSGCGWR